MVPRDSIVGQHGGEPDIECRIDDVGFVGVPSSLVQDSFGVLHAGCPDQQLHVVSNYREPDRDGDIRT